eukprot:3852660-Pyramimonas_sp.AAC.1
MSAPLLLDRCPPRWHHERSQGSQERVNRAPRGAQEAPKALTGAQEASRRLPKEPPRGPKKLSEAPTTL